MWLPVFWLLLSRRRNANIYLLLNCAMPLLLSLLHLHVCGAFTESRLLNGGISVYKYYINTIVKCTIKTSVLNNCIAAIFYVAMVYYAHQGHRNLHKSGDAGTCRVLLNS